MQLVHSHSTELQWLNFPSMKFEACQYNSIHMELLKAANLLLLPLFFSEYIAILYYLLSAGAWQESHATHSFHSSSVSIFVQMLFHMLFPFQPVGYLMIRCAPGLGDCVLLAYGLKST